MTLSSSVHGEIHHYIDFLGLNFSFFITFMLAINQNVMKKLLPCLLLVILLGSCKTDDDNNVVAQCTEALNIQTTEIGINFVSLEWNDTNGPIEFTIEYGETGFVPGTGTFVSSDTRSVTLTNLDAGKGYDVYVQSICSVDNISMQSQAFSFTTMPPLVVAQFLPNLSDLNLFIGDMQNLEPSPYTFEYDLATPLFTDYAHKQRLIALPQGEKMSYQGDGLPIFPDNTVIVKTFSYNYDETDLSQGRLIIETRLLIKINGAWELGNYHWNEDQTDAVLSPDSALVPVTYVDEQGITNNITYEIPSAEACFDCHNNAQQETPIGPKLRTLNFDGQLQEFITKGFIDGLPDATLVNSLPSWDDPSFSREQRARAYFDVNCAHCHSEGGFCGELSNLRLNYETPFEDSKIYIQRFNILLRMSEYIPQFSMPYIGTTIVHQEGYDLIESYIQSLD